MLCPKPCNVDRRAKTAQRQGKFQNFATQGKFAAESEEGRAFAD